jgi:hypothetical protein
MSETTTDASILRAASVLKIKRASGFPPPSKVRPTVTAKAVPVGAAYIPGVRV